MDSSCNECSHNIVVDWIDIDLDTSKQIIYCENCHCTFDIDSQGTFKPQNRQLEQEHQ